MANFSLSKEANLQYSSEGLTTNQAENVRNAILAREKPIHDTDIFQAVCTRTRPRFRKTSIDIIMINMETMITNRL